MKTTKKTDAAVSDEEPPFKRKMKTNPRTSRVPVACIPVLAGLIAMATSNQAKWVIGAFIISSLIAETTMLKVLHPKTFGHRAKTTGLRLFIRILIGALLAVPYALSGGIDAITIILYFLGHNIIGIAAYACRWGYIPISPEAEAAFQRDMAEAEENEAEQPYPKIHGAMALTFFLLLIAGAISLSHVCFVHPPSFAWSIVAVIGYYVFKTIWKLDGLFRTESNPIEKSQIDNAAQSALREIGIGALITLPTCALIGLGIAPDTLTTMLLPLNILPNETLKGMRWLRKYWKTRRILAQTKLQLG